MIESYHGEFTIKSLNQPQPPNLMFDYRLPYDKMLVFCWINPVESPSDTKQRLFVQRLGVSERPVKFFCNLWRIFGDSSTNSRGFVLIKNERVLIKN